MAPKEGRYYVEYLGWKECKGLHGRHFTEPIIRELLLRQRHKNQLPRMTIKINQKEIQISQETDSKKSNGKNSKVKYPPIPTKDCSFVIQALYPDTEVVACVFLGYNPYTKCAIHTHAYRFDSEATANVFVKHLSSIIEDPIMKKRIQGIEDDLAELGHATHRSSAQLDSNGGSDGMSQGTPSPQSSEGFSPSRHGKFQSMEEALRQRHDITIQKQPKQPEPDPKAKKIFHNLQEEFQYKVKIEEAPLLLPPKDYDTIVRRHGNLEIRNEVKPSAAGILGPNSIFNSMDERFVNHIQDDVSEESNTQSSSDTTDLSSSHTQEKYDGSFLEPPINGGIKRSQSDTNAHLARPTSSLQRQASQASSDRGSSYSDDNFADNLYKGFKPRHVKSKSRDDDYDAPPDDMVMYSPSYSFGQNGVRQLPTHHEQHENHETQYEEEPLMRTAPASYFHQSVAPQIKRYSTNDQRVKVKQASSQRRSDGYTITTLH